MNIEDLYDELEDEEERERLDYLVDQYKQVAAFEIQMSKHWRQIPVLIGEMRIH